MSTYVDIYLEVKREDGWHTVGLYTPAHFWDEDKLTATQKAVRGLFGREAPKDMGQADIREEVDMRLAKEEYAETGIKLANLKLTPVFSGQSYVAAMVRHLIENGCGGHVAAKSVSPEIRDLYGAETEDNCISWYEIDVGALEKFASSPGDISGWIDKEKYQRYLNGLEDLSYEDMVSDYDLGEMAEGERAATLAHCEWHSITDSEGSLWQAKQLNKVLDSLGYLYWWNDEEWRGEKRLIAIIS